jgi:dihydrofolate reductase
MNITLIVAADLNDCIGQGNDIPWHIPSDLRRFKALTMGSHLIAGRKTQDSIVARLGHTLPGRITYVLSRMAEPATGFSCSFDTTEKLIMALEKSHASQPDKEVFLIGGAATYKILLTRIHTRVHGDTFMPQSWLGGFMQVEAQGSKLWDPRDEFESSYTTYERFKDHG